MSMKLLTKSNLPRASVEQNFKILEFVKEYPPELQFQIGVPNNWGSEVLVTEVPSLPDNPVTKIATLREVDNPNMDITVLCAALAREINPSDWLSIWLDSQNYKKIDVRVLPSPYGSIGDVLASKEIDNKIYYCRLMALKDADRIYLLTAKVHTNINKEFERAQEIFLIAFQTFKLLQPTKQKLAEKFSVEDLKLPSSLPMLLPDSWEVLPLPEVPEGGAGMQLINKLGDQTVGNLFIISFENEEDYYLDVYDALFDKLLNNGFKFKKPNSEYVTKHLSPELSPTSHIILEAKKGKSKLQFMLYRKIQNNTYVILLLISPIEEMEIKAINTRAVQIALIPIGLN